MSDSLLTARNEQPILDRPYWRVLYSHTLGIKIKTTLANQDALISIPPSLEGSAVTFSIGWANRNSVQDPKKDIAESLIHLIFKLAPMVYGVLKDDANFFWSAYELKSKWSILLILSGTRSRRSLCQTSNKRVQICLRE